MVIEDNSMVITCYKLTEIPSHDHLIKQRGPTVVATECTTGISRETRLHRHAELAQ